MFLCGISFPSGTIKGTIFFIRQCECFVYLIDLISEFYLPLIRNPFFVIMGISASQLVEYNSA